jgi:hypothetical protein
MEKNRELFFTNPQRLLLNKVDSMSTDVQQAYAEGKVNLSEGSYFKRIEITGISGLFNILKNDDSLIDGICDISKQKIEQGANLALSRISVKVASQVATTTTAGSAVYQPISQCNDGVLRNAEIEILCKQKRILRLPLSEFTQVVGQDSEKCWVNLAAPKLITDQDDIQARLYIPESLAVATTDSGSNAAKTFFEVLLAGAVLQTNA